MEELLARLGSETEPLTAEELASLEEQLLAAFAEERDAEAPSLERLTEIRDTVRTVREAAAALADAEAEIARQIAELEAELQPVAEEDPEPEAEEEPEADPAPDTEDDPEPEATVEEPAAEPEPVAAAAPPAPAPRRVPAALRPRPRPNREETVILAAGDVPGFSAGSRIQTLDAVGRAFAEKASHMNPGQQAAVASFRLPALPEGRTLAPTDARGNTDKLDAVAAAVANVPLANFEEALTAAGGLCAPTPGAYDLIDVSTAARPIRDSLMRFNADRGGIRFIAPPELTDVVDAVGLWTEANDTDPGSAGSETKPCLTITCGSETEVVVDAVTLCLQVGNFSRRTFPEQFARWFSVARAFHARTAENKLWDRMCTLSTAVTGGAVTDGAHILGTARDVLVDVARAAAAMRSRHRMAADATIEIWAPAWLRDNMQADLARQLPGDNALNVALSEIEGYFRTRNILAHWTLEGGAAGEQTFAAEAGGALQGWNSNVEIIISHPGAFTFLDGGTLDLGTEIRDSTLIGTNDVRAFLETFENVAFRGVESLCLTLNICPSGATAATEDTSALCTTGS